MATDHRAFFFICKPMLVWIVGIAIGWSVASTLQAQEIQKLHDEFIFEAAPFPSCHASTIVQASDGTMVAAWFGGKHEKADDVGIWISRRTNGTWTTPVEVANGVQFAWETGDKSLDARAATSVRRFPTWNPVLFQPSKGPLLLFYKAGPSPQTWWGMLMESRDAGLTWSTPVRLPEGILGPIKNKPIELEDGSLLCPSINETPDEKEEWTIHMERTPDLGKTWSRTQSLHSAKDFGAIQPSILRLGGSNLLAIGRSKQGKLFEITSNDLGKTWGDMKLTDVPNPNSGADAVTLLDGRHLLVYNHVTKESAQWGGKRSPLNVALSKDGHSWTPVLELENEPNKEFSYPAVIQTADGRIHITYTWKRARIKYVVLELPKGN